MEPVKHPSNNKILGKPSNWDEAVPNVECGDLGVTVQEQGRTLRLTSYWRPTQGEIDLLMEGGLIALTIYSAQHPPVSLNAVDPLPAFVKIPEPTNADEYLERFARNNKISGYGMETTMHMPCPFCAAPDFLVYAITDTFKALDEGATCKHCDRSQATVETRSEDGLQVRLAMFQTGGPDQPEWLTPKMPRAHRGGDMPGVKA
jgi:hypothetical protein